MEPMTAAATETIRAIDCYAIQAACDALVVADCVGSADRMRQHLEHVAILYADRLAEGGVDVFAAQVSADRFLQAALWCLSTPAQLPDAILADAVARAAIIAAISGHPRAAVQCAMYAGLTAAAEVLERAELEAFAARLEQAVDAAVVEPQGRA